MYFYKPSKINMKNKKKSDKKMLKVIYYDENTAMDYITIMNGGNITTEEIKKAIEGTKTDVAVGAGINIKNTLLNMLGLSFGLNSDIAGNSYRERIINSTITSNVMTEFIRVADEDDNIEKLYGLKLEIEKDTVTFLKSIFPYVSLIKNPEETINELGEFNISKIDDVILSTKGYFEFTAKKEKQDFAILRFNINCFRNNYKLNDLLKMDLCYYGIKVGDTTKDAIKFENEINQTQKVLTEEDITEIEEEHKLSLPIYDVIIAGVKNEKN